MAGSRAFISGCKGWDVGGYLASGQFCQWALQELLSQESPDGSY